MRVMMLFKRSCLVVFVILAFSLLSAISVKNVFADQGFDSSPPTCSGFDIIGTPTVGNTLTVSFNCSDSGGSGIASISLAINGTTVATTSSTSLSYTWIPASAATYTLTSTAQDKAGNINTSSPTTFTINNTTPLQPNITFLKSCTNTTVTNPAQFMNITWNSINPPVSWVVFGLGNYFWYNKYVYGLTSTTAPDGFYGYWNTSGAMPLYPYNWYSVQLYNGTWGAISWVYIQPCGPPPQPAITYNASCFIAPYTGSGITISWLNNEAPVTGVYIADTTDPNNWKWYQKLISSTANQQTQVQAPNGFVRIWDGTNNGQQLALQPNVSYMAYIDNGWWGGWSPGAQISINAPPAAQSCPSTCHTDTQYVPNGSCGTTSCPSNAPAAGTIPACRTSGGSVSNGTCGTTPYTANCSTTCVNNTCQSPPSWSGNPPYVLNSCTNTSYTGTLSWKGYPYYTDPDGAGPQPSQWGFWANLAENSSFNPYYHKWVPCANQNPTACSNVTNSTPIATGFTLSTGNTTLTLNSQTTYYAQVYNGDSSSIINFFKTCPPAPPVIDPTYDISVCPQPGTKATIYWHAPVQSATVTSYTTKLGTMTHTNLPATYTTDNFTTVPGSYSYGSVSACNSGGCSSEKLIIPLPLTCIPKPAFLQSSGGDVHSNQ